MLAAVALAASGLACDGIAGIQLHGLAGEAGADADCFDAGLEAGAECPPAVGDDAPSGAPEED